jgi:hypothetical protein
MPVGKHAVPAELLAVSRAMQGFIHAVPSDPGGLGGQCEETLKLAAA